MKLLFHNHMAIEMVYEIFGYYDSTVVRQLPFKVEINFSLQRKK